LFFEKHLGILVYMNNLMNRTIIVATAGTAVRGVGRRDIDGAFGEVAF
jgi:hypothetical protein